MHQTAQDCRDHGRLKESALVLWNLSLGTLPFLGGLQCIGWFSRRDAWPAPPGLRSLREQSSIMLNFVFQELPLWGGATGQLCISTATSCVCKEAKNTGFLDDLGFNFVFIAPDKIQLSNGSSIMLF